MVRRRDPEAAPARYGSAQAPGPARCAVLARSGSVDRFGGRRPAIPHVARQAPAAREGRVVRHARRDRAANRLQCVGRCRGRRPEPVPSGRSAGLGRRPARPCRASALGKRSTAVWPAAKAAVARAAAAACPIVLEHLDFRKKKAWLRSYGKRFAEVLSLFRSRQVRDAVEREARRNGVEVRYVDPAWTTRLGNLKYRRRCRLGTHHAAALVIGRRGLGIGERLPYGLPSLPHTVECVSTTGASRTLVQRLPAAWLQGGRRRTGQRTRAPDAPGAGA